MHCRDCRFTTRTTRSLKLHLASHPKFQCEQSSFNTNDKLEMKTHCSRSQRNHCFQCYLCDMKFRQKKWLVKHLQSHQDVFKKPDELGTHTCEQCAFKSCSVERLIQHQQIAHQMQHCDELAFKIKCPKKLVNHGLLHKPSEELSTFKCNLCSYQSNKKPLFLRHKRKHRNSEWLYKCQHCSFKGVSKKALTGHQLKDHDEGTYKCQHCSFRTRNVQRLQTHVLHYCLYPI